MGDKLFVVRRMTEADLKLALGWAAGEFFWVEAAEEQLG